MLRDKAGGREYCRLWLFGYVLCDRQPPGNGRQQGIAILSSLSGKGDIDSQDQGVFYRFEKDGFRYFLDIKQGAGFYFLLALPRLS